MVEAQMGPSHGGSEAEATHTQVGPSPGKFKPGPAGMALVWAWGHWVQTDWKNEDLRHHPFRPLKPEPPEIDLEPEEDW